MHHWHAAPQTIWCSTRKIPANPKPNYLRDAVIIKKSELIDRDRTSNLWRAKRQKYTPPQSSRIHVPQTELPTPMALWRTRTGPKQSTTGGYTLIVQIRLSVALFWNSCCFPFLAVVLLCVQSSTFASKSLRVMGLRRTSFMPASKHLVSYSFDEVPVRPIIVHLKDKKSHIWRIMKRIPLPIIYF